MNDPQSDNPFANTSPASEPKSASSGGSRPTASALDAVIPTNPLAAFSCYTGIIGLIFCPLGACLGPLALVLAFLSVKTWKVKESSLGSTTSTIRLVIGIVTGVLATIIGLLIVGIYLMGAFREV
ncbi:MAG: hypothetical protein R3B96_02420 [Pirellulaceae bacterium]